MANVSRLKVDHPTLGTAGGSALHASIEAIYKKLGDSVNARFYELLDFDTSEAVDLDHNYNTDIANIRYDLYNLVGGELIRLTASTSPLRSAFTVLEKDGTSNDILTITNVSGGNDLSLYVVLVNDPIALVDGDILDIDITSVAPEDGQALVYETASKKFKPGASGDSSFKIQSISDPSAMLKGGYLLLEDSRELATYNGSLYGADITVSLDTLLGSDPANATSYYLYIDLNALGSEQTEAATGRKLYQVTISQLFLSTTSPANIDAARFVPLGVITSATSGTVWSGSGSAFRTLASRNAAPTLANVLGETHIRNYLRAYAKGVTSPVVSTLASTTANIANLTNFHADSTSGVGAIAKSSSTALRGSTNYLSALSGANTNGSVFFQLPAFSLDGSDLGKPVSVSFDLASSIADGDYDAVVVRYNSSGTHQEILPLSGNASSASVTPSAKLPLGAAKFSSFFIAGNTAGDLYALRFRRLVGTQQIRIDTLNAGPDLLMQGAAIADSVNWTPTGSWSANTAYAGKYRRRGNKAEVEVLITLAGAPTSAALSVNLPFTIDTSDLAGGTSVRNLSIDDSSNIFDASPATLLKAVVGYGTTTSVNVTVEKSDGTYGTLNTDVTATVPVTFDSGDLIFLRFSVPVVGWSSNTTMANRAVEEYSYNSGTWDSADTTSFGYGYAGAAIPGSLGASRTKRVRFQTPIQPTDKISIEFSTDRIVWMPMENAFLGSTVVMNTINAAGTFASGVYILPIASNSIDIDLVFGTYQSAANDDSPAVNWSAGYWRVRKVSGGASVGYPVSARNVVGDISGKTVPSGFIGERIDGSTLTTASVTTSESTLSTLSLTPGSWRIHYEVMGEIVTGASAGNRSYLATRILDSGNTTTIGKSSRSLHCRTPAAAVNVIKACLAASATVNIAGSTSYNLRALLVNENGTGSAQFYNDTGTTPPQESVFYAIRIG